VHKLEISIGTMSHVSGLYEFYRQEIVSEMLRKFRLDKYPIYGGGWNFVKRGQRGGSLLSHI